MDKPATGEREEVGMLVSVVEIFQPDFGAYIRFDCLPSQTYRTVCARV